MPTAPFLTKLRTDAMVAAREANRDTASPSRHLAAVEDLPRPTMPRLPSTRAAELSVHSVRFDRQGRASSRQLLAELGWGVATRLTVEVDRDAQVLWLREAAVVAARGSVTGHCACEGCSHPTPLPTLPGPTRTAVDTVRVDGKLQLCLTPGLRQAIGVEAPGQALLVNLPTLETVAVVAPSALFRLLVGDGLTESSPQAVKRFDPATAEEYR